MTKKTPVHSGEPAPADEGADDSKAIWDSLDKAEADQAAAAETPAADAGGAEPGKKTDAPVETPAKEKPAADAAATDQNDNDKDKAGDKGTGKPAPEAADIWATATPEQRAAHEATRKELNDTTTNYRRVSGTVSGIQRKADALQAELDTLKKGGKPPASGASGAKDGAAPADEDDIFKSPEIVAAEKDYPEVIGPIKKVLKTLHDRNESLARELGGISSERRALNQADQEKIVDEAHPDYDQIIGTPQFVAWYNRAPAYIKAGVNRNAERVVDGEEVAHIVASFKSETKWASPNPAPKPAGDKPADGGTPKPAPASSSKRQLQLESAASPRGKGPSPIPEGESDDPAAIWKQFDEQERRSQAR